MITAVEPTPPVRYVNRLGANMPNPFNPTTLASGVYVVVLEGEGFRASRRLVLLK